MTSSALIAAPLLRASSKASSVAGGGHCEGQGRGEENAFGMTRHQRTVLVSAFFALGLACAPAESVQAHATPVGSASPGDGAATCVPCTHVLPKPGYPAGADGTIRSVRGCFRQCYQHGLNTDRDMQGKVIVAVDLSPSGDVGCAAVDSNVGLSDTVAACIVGCVQTARFEPVGNDGACLQVPVTFRKVN